MSYILLIEDNPQHADLAMRILSTAGFQVKHSLSGHKGIQQARQELPELILLDLELPQMSGLTIATIIRKQLQDNAPPIVAVTGYAEASHQQSAKQVGCVAYITKPYPPHQLLATVGYFLKANVLEHDVVLL